MSDHIPADDTVIMLHQLADDLEAGLYDATDDEVGQVPHAAIIVKKGDRVLVFGFGPGLNHAADVRPMFQEALAFLRPRIDTAVIDHEGSEPGA